MSDYTQALELLVKQSGLARTEVVRDPDTAAWFIAQRTEDKATRKEAFEAAGIVFAGRPQ